MIVRLLSLVTLVAVSASTALAQFDSGSDGSDGAFNPTANLEVDLSVAAAVSWATPSPVPGQGVYDAQQWAVVFKFTTIDIPSGVTVTFANHPKGAPVVFLASGDVTINGTIDVSGDDADADLVIRYAEPGPGGLAGGADWSGLPVGSAGFGPGAGQDGPNAGGGGGGYGTSGQGSVGFGVPTAGGAVYGNSAILPLVGGSGGGGGTGGGGAGGGAVLIASSGDLYLGTNSEIRAGGGNGGPSGFWGGGGSGGAIRLIANLLSGAGTLTAVGGTGNIAEGKGHGGDGRIRLEATVITTTDPGNPLYTADDPGPVFPLPGTPTLRAIMVDSSPISADPRAGVQTVDADVLTDTSLVDLQIEAANIPVGYVVDVIGAPAAGAQVIGCFGLTGTTTTVQLNLDAGTTDIVLRAHPGPCP